MPSNPTLQYRPIAEVSDQKLQWVQPGQLQRHHELVADDQVVGTIDFERQTLANARSGGGSWTFKREGFWHPFVTVRAAGSEASIAVFRPGWLGGGHLELADGQTYELKVASFWHSEWEWRQHDQVLVSFKRPSGLLRSSATVDLSAEAWALPVLDLLVLVGWYLMLLYAQDMALGTAVMAASGG